MGPEQLDPQDIENHDKFLERLRGKVTDLELEYIDMAYDFAKYGHRNQLRDDGTRYFEHCRETALIMIDEMKIFDAEMIMAALMHDMLEDNFLMSSRRIQLIFGDRVMALVVVLTKPKKCCKAFKSDHERHQFYFIKIYGSPVDAKIIKLPDRLHNLRTLQHCAEEKRLRKIEETIKVYLPLIEDVAASRPEIADFFRREFDKALNNLR